MRTSRGLSLQGPAMEASARAAARSLPWLRFVGDQRKPCSGACAEAQGPAGHHWVPLRNPP